MTALPLLAILLAAGGAKPAGSVRWEKSFTAAMAKAKAGGKPVMIDFWAEWCGYCHELDRKTYVDPKVVQVSEQFAAVKVNTEGTKYETDIATKYLVTNLPTILFISPAGRPIFRLNGFVPARVMARAMEEVHRRAVRVVAWEAALDKDPNDVAALAGLGLNQFGDVARAVGRDPEARMSRHVFEDVEDLLRRAYRLDGGRPVAERKRVRTAMGLLNSMRGRFDTAERLLKESLALRPKTPDDAKALNGLGEVYLMQDRIDLARDSFRKAAAGHPGTEEAKLAERYLQNIP